MDAEKNIGVAKEDIEYSKKELKKAVVALEKFKKGGRKTRRN